MLQVRDTLVVESLWLVIFLGVKGLVSAESDAMKFARSFLEELSEKWSRIGPLLLGDTENWQNAGSRKIMTTGFFTKSTA